MTTGSAASGSMASPSPERIADQFINYLFDEYGGDTLHVRRVASWLGLIALGVDRVKDQWSRSHSRQLVFEAGSKRYKVKYDHAIKPRGGIAIVEIAKAQGSPEIGVVRSISSLQEAADFYDDPTL